MNKKTFVYLSIGILSVFVWGCELDLERTDSESKVELYLLNSYSKMVDSYQIDEASVLIENSPLISYADLLSYDSLEYAFEISNKAMKAIENLEHSVHGLAFGIKADETLVYTGYFWPSYSSAICDWIVIDPIMASIDNKIIVSLGYPGLLQGMEIPDKRNDSRIIKIFESDNKLIK